jgi:hypothetical protein
MRLRNEGWDARKVRKRKGGNLAGSALPAKNSHRIAEGAVAIAILLSDFGQGALVHEVGAERFVTSVQQLGGLEEELMAKDVIHGVTSEIVTDFLGAK